MAKNKTEVKKKSVWDSIKNFFVKVGRWCAGVSVRVYQDLARMRWANKKTIIATTGIVLSFMLIFGLYIIIDDFLIAQIFRVIY